MISKLNLKSETLNLKFWIWILITFEYYQWFRNKAAVSIQRTYRGRLGRKIMKKKLDKKNEILSAKMIVRVFLSFRHMIKMKAEKVNIYLLINLLVDTYIFLFIYDWFIFRCFHFRFSFSFSFYFYFYSHLIFFICFYYFSAT